MIHRVRIDPRLLDGRTFDLVVVGAGIQGAAIARDAALRGLQVLLLDRRDLAAGTSSRSSRLVHGGLRFIKRGTEKAEAVPFTKNDTFVDELDEFAAAVRGQSVPETGGEYATRSLGVIRAGIISAREGRRVQLAEVLADPNA